MTTARFRAEFVQNNGVALASGPRVIELDGFTTPITAVTMRGLSATPTAKGVTVRWRTASELDLLGFHVYPPRVFARAG